MRQQFLRAILPSQGVYCAVAIEPGTNTVHQKFLDSLHELEELLEDTDGMNVYVAPNSFKDHSRLSSHAMWAKSFFVDLDVGPEKPYKNKADATDSLTEFTQRTGLPDAVITDSGTGVHGFWPFNIDLPIDEWRPYAKLFKQFCINNGLMIDATVTADAARIMRCPDTENYKTNPPSKTYVISSSISTYDFAHFKAILGEPPADLTTLLAEVVRGVDEESAAVRNRGIYDTNFTDIVLKSMGQVPAEEGCRQIAYMINEPNRVPYPLWFAGLSVAARCDDGQEAIHKLSEDYNGYTKENTDFKAAETLKATGPHKCSQFDEVNPGVCPSCPHWKKITTPIELGRRFRAAPTLTEQVPGSALALVVNGSGAPLFPKELYPFARLKSNRGIYMLSPPDEEGTPQPALQLVPHDLYPIKRVVSDKNGAGLLMNYETPFDGTIEYVIFTKELYQQEAFASIVMFHGVVPTRDKVKYLMDYHQSWFEYMQNLKIVELMHTQMGFTDDKKGFVYGSTEYRSDGTERPAAPSPYVRALTKLMVPEGDYADWRAAADYLNAPSMEIHAFAMMCAFGSPLMGFTSTNGACVSLYGPKGVAKTGALFACLSVYGNPKEISLFNSTDNAAIQRMLTLHNIPYCRDEASNMDPLSLSNLIHTVSSGKSKIRLQSSADAERPLERSASMIALFTSNHALQAKLETLKANPEGEMARLVELYISAKPSLFADDAELSTRIFDTFRTCYGHAGPMFVRHLYKVGLDGVATRINQWIKRFRGTFGSDAAYRFYENLIAATFAGTELANEAGIVKFDLERIYGAVMRHVCSVRDDVPLNDMDYESVIGEYMHRNTQNTLIMKGGTVVIEPKGELKVRVDLTHNTQTVSKTDFKKYLATMQISPREFETRVRQENLLTITEKARLSVGWRNNAPQIRVYEFKCNVDDVISELTANVPPIKQ